MTNENLILHCTEIKIENMYSVKGEKETKMEDHLLASMLFNKSNILDTGIMG